MTALATFCFDLPYAKLIYKEARPSWRGEAVSFSEFALLRMFITVHEQNRYPTIVGQYTKDWKGAKMHLPIREESFKGIQRSNYKSFLVFLQLLEVKMQQLIV